jgi:hypothetical protein
MPQLQDVLPLSFSLKQKQLPQTQFVISILKSLASVRITIYSFLSDMVSLAQTFLSSWAVRGTRKAKHKAKRARVGTKYRGTKENMTAWFKSQFEGIIHVRSSIYFAGSD